MKHFSLIAATLLLGTSLYAEDTAITGDVVSSESDWNFNVLIEERISSDNSSQTLLKLQAGRNITDKLSFFSGIWLRDKLPFYFNETHQGEYEKADSEYINYIDIYAGLSYNLHQYFNPYFFYEVYYDRPHESDEWGGFLALGFSGTLYNENKHNISYYSEFYYTLGTYDLDNFNYWSSETALKYKYSIYEKTALYIQAVWNTDQDAEGYGIHDFSEGTYSTRLGIQVDF
jgi:hypothetical protein